MPTTTGARSSPEVIQEAATLEPTPSVEPTQTTTPTLAELSLDEAAAVVEEPTPTLSNPETPTEVAAPETPILEIPVEPTATLVETLQEAETLTPTATLEPTATPEATATPTATLEPTPTAMPEPGLLEDATTSESLTMTQISARYWYDGDGTLVKGDVDGLVTYYVGRHYHKEVNDGVETIRKFYYAGSMLVAARTITGGQDTLTWILADHLGSTQVTANANGSKASELKYTAFGEKRPDSGDTTATKYQYTGQLSQMEEIGLYYYVARWYDPVTTHFVSADIYVPESQGILGWDRYAYANSNPIRYNDPSGHCIGPLLLVCIGVGLVVAAVSIDAINNGLEQVQAASSQPKVIDQEQAAAQQWQDNCLGQCHYSQAVNSSPNVTVGGPRPNTPVSDTLVSGYYNIAQGAAGLISVATGTAQVAINNFSIKTPYGRAWQPLSKEALQLRSQVSKGAQIYRGGVMGKSNVAEGQFWAMENPLNPGYANRYGAGSYSNLPDFIIGGYMKPGEPFITRAAPGVGVNSGGALEIVSRPNGVHLNFYYMR